MPAPSLPRRAVLAAPLLLLPHAPATARQGSAFSAGGLRALDAELRASHPDIRAFLVQREGLAGYTYYRADTDAQRQLNVASVTKSVTSLLVGIAAGRGLLRLDDALATHFPEHPRRELERITLRHLLTMTAGFAHGGATRDDYNDFSTRLYAPGWLAHALSRRVDAPPGQRFAYNNWDAHLLAVMLARRVGQPLAAFAREVLFGPIGIGDVGWSAGSDGIPSGAADLRLAAPDLARLGQLVLQGGQWEGRQVVPRDYVEQATMRQVTSDVPPRGRADWWGYGYLWWTGSTPDDAFRVFAAAGYGGQFIYVVPGLGLVVVALTEPRSLANGQRTNELIRNFALAAVAR